MKKALALVLALVLALSLGVTAFAATPGTTVIETNGSFAEIVTSQKEEILGLVTEDATYGWTANKYEIPLLPVDNVEGVWALDEDGKKVYLLDSTDPFYNLNVVDKDGNPVNVWKGHYQINYIGGKEFATVALASDGETIVVTATSKALVEKGTLKFSVQGIGSYVGADGKTKVAKSKVVNFQITFNPDWVGGAKNATIDASLPVQLYLDEFVISADQFAMVAKETLTINALDGEFVLTTKVVKGQGAFNFKYNTTVAEAVADANEDAHIRAINFIGNQTFKGDAKITLSNAVGGWLSLGDIIDHTGDETVYVYTYSDGKLTLVNKQDASKGNVVYTAPAGKALGSIYFSDKELKGAASSSSGSSSDGKSNVNTGANDMVSVAVAMAVVSLAAAGAVAFKKASK